MEKIIALLDCNNFYASCERAFNPALNGKPIVILSNNDGCIIARSNEAKALGIPMGEPYFKAKHIIENNNVKVFSSNYTLYGDMSARVMATLAEFVKDIEIYSIDEAFIDLTNYPEPEKLANTIRQSVGKWTGIPVSIGIGQTKTLAKAANRVAKKYKSYNGVFRIDAEERRQKALKSMHVGDVWGIGRQINKKLASCNINTAYDLSIQPDNWIKSNLTICGLRTAQELRGNACIEFEETPEARKSIVVSRSFGGTVFEHQGIKEALSNFAERAAVKLRGDGLLAKRAQVFLYHELVARGGSNHNSTITVEFDYPTDSTCEIIKATSAAISSMFVAGMGYKKCGLVLLGLINKAGFTKDLFDNRNLHKQDSVMQAMDYLNNSMGSGTIMLASSKGKGGWVAKKDNKSFCYTTRWDELPVVH